MKLAGMNPYQRNSYGCSLLVPKWSNGQLLVGWSLQPLDSTVTPPFVLFIVY